MNPDIPVHKFYIYALTALGYFLLGFAGLKLAIPPGYSSVIFPAAGLGFIVVLTGGIRFLPAIWLGSFALNVWIAFQSSTIDLTTLCVAALLGIGASLQAWGASSLIKNLTNINWKELSSAKEIFLFLALAGPLGSLISATWGNISLYIFNIISVDNLFLNWVNWWLGDATGVITVAPLLLIIAFMKVQPWTKRKTHVLLPVAIALTTSVLLFFYMSEKESNEITAKLAETGENVADRLIAKLLIYQEATASVETLNQNRPKLDYKEFKAFTQPILERHQDLQAIGFNAYITSENRALFEAELAKQFERPHIFITELDASGSLVKAQNRDWYTPVKFIVPLEGNEKALAYDIASNSLRLEAINRAIKTNKQAITAPIRLVQETGSSNGILVINPVSSQKNHHIDGFSVAVIRIENIIKSLLAAHVAQGLSITIKDNDPKLQDGMLYTSVHSDSQANSNFIWMKDLDIGQRNWQLSITPSKHYTDQFSSYLPWQVLLAALWLTSLLQILLLSITGQHYRDSQKIEEQNKTLESMAHYDVLTGLPNRTLFNDRYHQALPLNIRNKTLLAVGFLDLDKFKPVNDTYGHDIGDQLLIEVAKRIQLVLRENDTVCRIGGDEFVLLIGNLSSAQECSDILKRLLNELAQPLLIETFSIEITASCGVTLYPNDNSDLDALLRHADQAMYQAKASGKNQFKIYNPRELS